MIEKGPVNWTDLWLFTRIFTYNFHIVRAICHLERGEKKSCSYCYIDLARITLLCWLLLIYFSYDDWIWIKMTSCTGHPLCSLSCPVMGKSLLRGVSPCQKYLSAAIIWHQEKVEGDTGCWMASCGCTLKRGLSSQYRSISCISAPKAFTMNKITMIRSLVLFDYFTPCGRQQPRITLPPVDDLLPWCCVYFY